MRIIIELIVISVVYFIGYSNGRNYVYDKITQILDEETAKLREKIEKEQSKTDA